MGAELREVIGLLARNDSRLVTLTGPGGSGKTRLLLQAAAEASERFPDGVFWIPLAPLRDGPAVGAAVAHTLDVREQPGVAIADSITRVFAGSKRSWLSTTASTSWRQLPPSSGRSWMGHRARGCARPIALDAHHLAESLGLLATRDRDVEERQRTLEATIAWSYELLNHDERRVLRALSVFAGGCTLSAAQAVSGAGLDLLESLLDKSLIRYSAIAS